MSTGKFAKRYNPLRTLGQGGMGTVWLVDDLVEHRQVALKAVQFVHADTNPVQAALAFKQEFRLMTRLRHPNCCAVYDYGVMDDESPYFTMEWVPGKGLDELLPLDAATLRHVLVQLLQALGHVHDLGLVHGDVKPANVRLTPDNQVKLMDYGLMEYAGRTGAPIRGTLAYLAPEVVRRGTIDQRADLYAVGALAYELWAGEPPFNRDKAIDILRAQVNEMPVPLLSRRPGLDADLVKAIARLLAKDPLSRPQSAYEALEDLGIAGEGAVRARLLTSAMVGRETELTYLRDWLTAVGRGVAGNIVGLWGGPGVGKSRLAEEFRFEVQLANVPMAATPNHEFAQSPYGPVVRVLRALMPAFKAHVREDLARLSPVLAKVLPEMGITPAPELDSPSTEKLRLQAAMADIILALAHKTGLVLILEDWQWADPLSEQFLDHLVRNWSAAPLLLLLTSHRDPAEDAPPNSWRAVVETLPLTGLSVEAVGRVMTSMLGISVVEPALVARMAALSEGNPYMVEMILEHLLEIGALSRVRGAWVFEEPKGYETLPHDLWALQALKLERLDATARQVARTAASIGYRFDLGLLMQVTGMEDDVLFGALDALVTHHVFVAGDDGAYRFARDQLQSVLYQAIDENERPGLHTAIARALEVGVLNETPDGDPSLDALTMVADQYMRGTIPEKAIAYCLMAGIRHARLFATNEAARYLEAGLAQLNERGGERWRRARLDYLAHLGDVRRIQGEYPAALAHYAGALPLAAALGDDFRACRIWVSLAKVQQATQTFSAALESAAKGVELALAIGDDGEAARGLATSGRVRYFLGDTAGAIADHERARERAEAGEDLGKAHTAAAFLGYLLVLSVPERADEGRRLLADAVDYLLDSGDKVGLNNALDLLGEAQLTSDQPMAARETFGRKLAVCKEIGYREEEAVARVNLAAVALQVGAFTEALLEADRAIESADELGSVTPAAAGRAYAGLAALRLGDVPRGLAQSAQAVERSRARGNRYLDTAVLPPRIECLLYAGQISEAQLEAEALEGLLKTAGNLEAEVALRGIRAELAWRADDKDTAIAIAADTLKLTAHEGARGRTARLLRLQAQFALDAATLEAATACVQTARPLAEALGLRALLLDLDLLEGEIALAQGQPQFAGICFEGAEKLAKELGTRVEWALARFGRAATYPYDPVSAGLAKEARATLEAIALQLPDPQRAAFLALPERARVLEGNYVGHSLPRRTGRSSSPLPTLGEGLWRGM